MDITLDQIWVIASSVVAVASIIARFTPTPVDDGIAAIAHKVINELALNSGHAKNAEQVEAEKFKR
jgi:hypothetical protein